VLLVGPLPPLILPTSPGLRTECKEAVLCRAWLVVQVPAGARRGQQEGKKSGSSLAARNEEPKQRMMSIWRSYRRATTLVPPQYARTVDRGCLIDGAWRRYLRRARACPFYSQRKRSRVSMWKEHSSGRSVIDRRMRRPKAASLSSFSLCKTEGGQRDRQTGEVHARHAVIQPIGSALSSFSLLFCDCASDTTRSFILDIRRFFHHLSPCACFSMSNLPQLLPFFFFWLRKRRVLVNGTWKLKLGSHRSFLQHARGHAISSSFA